MAEDHLDRETSISADLTASGVKASTKSRFVAALDRLGGALVDNVNARIEASTDVRRAKAAGDVKLIQNIVDYGVQQMGVSPEFAERAFNTHFRKVLAAQENMDHILIEARRDLEENPPAEDVEGDISEDFFTRLEQQAEAASTNEMRQIFGRILAGEIRAPGSVSVATLNLCSLLDKSSAQLIERACVHRVYPGVLLKGGIDGVFSHSELLVLKDIGFLGDVGFGITWTINPQPDGRVVLPLNEQVFAAGFSSSAPISFPAYQMTLAGQGLAKCLNIRIDMESAIRAFKASNANVIWVGEQEILPDGKIYGSNLRTIWSRNANPQT